MCVTEKRKPLLKVFDIDESKDAISILENLSIDVDEDFLLVKERYLVQVKVFVVSIIKL